MTTHHNITLHVISHQPAPCKAARGVLRFTVSVFSSYLLSPIYATGMVLFAVKVKVRLAAGWLAG